MSGDIREGAVCVGVDLAKRVIQVHATDAGERVLPSRALPCDRFLPRCARLPAGCIVAMEASSSAHHWARKLLTLGLQPLHSGEVGGAAKHAVCAPIARGLEGGSHGMHQPDGVRFEQFKSGSQFAAWYRDSIPVAARFLHFASLHWEYGL